MCLFFLAENVLSNNVSLIPRKQISDRNKIRYFCSYRAGLSQKCFSVSSAESLEKVQVRSYQFRNYPKRREKLNKKTLRLKSSKEPRAENWNCNQDSCCNSNIGPGTSSWCMYEFSVCKEFIFLMNKICLPISLSPCKSDFDPPH